eukprot:CAMPEP_0198271030 /NCGR_PEP_ID=MMETSP1447-20131203/47501_1 /TAXON_ID=420782 /ORGANISM="Chaetoceros dichaeta, Strain CCMP1751" /LENGTH=278 /DNA_ID=CAMNT_0043963401 /DNA_START=115 /DNA_END=947 /DNA_ORIENTATION=-
MKAYRNTFMKSYAFLSLFHLSLAEDDFLCPLQSFVPFSMGGGSYGYSHMAAALLAIDDFNTRDSAVVPELESQIYQDCSVYIPESEFAVYDVSEPNIIPKLLVGRKSTCSSPPCAIVGPYASPPTIESSVIANAWDIPVITHGAEDPNLSGKKHPTVFRSCVNVHAMGEAIVQFLRSKGRTDFLGGLFRSGDYGIDSMEAIRSAAEESDGGLGFPHINVQKISPPFPGDSNEVNSIGYAMNQLKKSSYRTIFLALDVVSEGMLSWIADAAEEYQMNGG